jgi:Rrf2 family cysteine metabolism transcriptional repressor
MYLSKYHEYGLRSMILLASRSAPGTPQMLVQAREISEEEKIPRKFLEHVLSMLKKGGLLNSKMGVGGGYILSRPASQITLGQIIRALDGRLEPIQCVGKGKNPKYPCPHQAICGVHMVMTDVYISIAKILDGTSLEDVSNRVALAKEMSPEKQFSANTAMLLTRSADFTI